MPEFRLRLGRLAVFHCERQWQFDVTGRGLPDFDLWYVFQGVGMLEIDGVVRPAHRGRLFVLKPGQIVHGRHDPTRRLGVIFVHFDAIAGRAAARALPGETDVADADEHERLLRRVTRLASEAPAAAARLLESVLLALPHDAAAPVDAARAANARVLAVAQHVRERPGERFSVEELAARAGYARDHFAVLFKRATGVGPKEFCVRARIDRAAQLLRDSTLSVGDVAATLGYADVFFFSRQFKNRVGCSPTTWRCRR